MVFSRDNSFLTRAFIEKLSFFLVNSDYKFKGNSGVDFIINWTPLCLVKVAVVNAFGINKCAVCVLAFHH